MRKWCGLEFFEWTNAIDRFFFQLLQTSLSLRDFTFAFANLLNRSYSKALTKTEEKAKHKRLEEDRKKGKSATGLSDLIDEISEGNCPICRKDFSVSVLSEKSA